MKIVSVTVLHKDNRIYDLTINYKGQFTKLIYFPIHKVGNIHPYKHIDLDNPKVLKQPYEREKGELIW